MSTTFTSEEFASLLAAENNPWARLQLRVDACNAILAESGGWNMEPFLPLMRVLAEWDDEPHPSAQRQLAECAAIAGDFTLSARFLEMAVQVAPDLRRPATPRLNGWDVDGSTASAADIAASLHDHGVTVVRGALQPDHIQGMAAYFIPISNISDSAGLLTNAMPDRAGLHHLVPPKIIDATRPFCVDEPILHPHVSIVRRMPVDADGGLRWHQDLVAFCQLALNIWIPLTPCGVDAPTVAFVARRMMTTAPTQATPEAPSPWVIPEETLAQYTKGFEQFAPRLALGDLMIFLSTTLHRTWITPAMTQTRYSLELRID